jgi:hypothetical protein
MDVKVHYSGYAPAEPTSTTRGTACRPDGQADRSFVSSSDKARVTCLSCQKGTR